jgi:hypothetical protein
MVAPRATPLPVPVERAPVVRVARRAGLVAQVALWTTRAQQRLLTKTAREIAEAALAMPRRSGVGKR